jgi:hypothetical protein
MADKTGTFLLWYDKRGTRELTEMNSSIMLGDREDIFDLL